MESLFSAFTRIRILCWSIKKVLDYLFTFTPPLLPARRCRGLLASPHTRNTHTHTTTLMSVSSPSKKQSVPLWPLDAQITGLTQNDSCKSSHLSPRLNLEDLLSPSLLLLSCPSSHPNSYCPTSVAIVDSSSPTSKIFTSMISESDTDLFIPAAAPPFVSSI